MEENTELVPCKDCKGRGYINCVLGSLRCGCCGGSGKVAWGDNRTFAERVKDALRAGDEEKERVKKEQL